MITFEKGEIATHLEYLFKGLIKFLIGLLDVDVCEGVQAPFDNIFPLLEVLTISNYLEVQVPDVKIEDDKTLIVWIVLCIPRRAKVVECNFPVYLVLSIGVLIAKLHLLEMFSNRNIGCHCVDVVLGNLKRLGLLA